MQTALITAPQTFLYENILTGRGHTYGVSVSDELLSGWLVMIQQRQDSYLKVTTHYGYSGWLDSSALRCISPQECQLWNESLDHSSAVICRKTIDILKEPRVQSEIVSTLCMGSKVLLLDDSRDGWQKVETAQGLCGYLPAISLKQTSEISQTDSYLRSEILGYAKTYLGVPYRWGGKTHIGIDCSGLTFMSYYMCGILIYRDAAIVTGYPVQEIPISRIQPADLLYFPGHIALYLGRDKYIHSTGNLGSFGCVINSLNPQDPDYRKDLAENITAAGSIFPYCSHI